MIYKGSKEVSVRYFGTHLISAVYHGLQLVWEAINSCFGSGYWIGEKPWSDTDPWIE
jgi:hypothetical protein